MDDKYHGLADIDIDRVAVVIDIDIGRIIAVLGPCHVDHLAVGDVIAVAGAVRNIDAQVGALTAVVVVIFTDLDKDIVKGHLIAADRVALGLSIQPFVIETGLLVIGQGRLGHGEGSGHVDLCRVDRVGILVQRIHRLIQADKVEMQAMLIQLLMGPAPAGFINGGIDMVRIRISGMLGGDSVGIDPVIGVVAGSQGTADAVDIIDIVAGQDINAVIRGAAVMDIDGIPFQAFINEIGTDTADISDPVQILPVLDNAHLPAHIAFFQNLIKDLDPVQAVLGLGQTVDGIHNGQGPQVGVRFLLADLQAGQGTAGRAGILLDDFLDSLFRFFGGLLCLFLFCFLCRFFTYCLCRRGRFSTAGRFAGSTGRRAAGRQGTDGADCQQQNDLFFLHRLLLYSIQFLRSDCIFMMCIILIIK